MGDDGALQAFSQLIDRGLSSEVQQARWCPTMDLLAMLTADGQLQLHRLNWQRLWSVTFDSPVASFCWRPDGRQLAVGLREGAILLINTEDGETLERMQIFNNATVVCMSWGQMPETENKRVPAAPVDERARRLCHPPLPAHTPHSASAAALQNASLEGFSDRVLRARRDATWPSTSGALDLLACVSSNGDLAILGQGTFQLVAAPLVTRETLRISIQGAEDAIDLRCMTLAPDLSELNVCYVVGDTLRLATIDIAVFGGNQDLVQRISSMATDIAHGARSIHEICDQLNKEWCQARQAHIEFTNQLVSLLLFCIILVAGLYAMGLSFLWKQYF